MGSVGVLIYCNIAEGEGCSSSETGDGVVGIMSWRRDDEDVGAIIDSTGSGVAVCGIYNGPNRSYKGSSKNSVIGTSYICLLFYRISDE